MSSPLLLFKLIFWKQHEERQYSGSARVAPSGRVPPIGRSPLGSGCPLVVGCPLGVGCLTLLNSTELKMSILSENSLWMLLSRLVSIGALRTNQRADL